jgi:DNA-binding MarR family transcriptional regulator
LRILINSLEVRLPFILARKCENRSLILCNSLQKESYYEGVDATADSTDTALRGDHVHPLYLETVMLVERLHRELLGVIKDEFERRSLGHINSAQAFLLNNIGDKEFTAHELRTRGYYLGSNVSYNLKKLVEMGFLDYQPSLVDRRSVRVKLTDKGREVRDIVDKLYHKHASMVEQVGGINANEFTVLNQSLRRLERFWIDQISNHF